MGGLTHVLGLPEFRVVFTADVASVAGDQLARVALAVLVYDRTGSAGWAAGTYALTFLPALLGGVLLGWTADRFRRRTVVVVTDLLRAAVLGVMALPGLPLPALWALLAGAVLLGAPHTAALGALMPEILGDRYEQGLALRQIASQTAQLAGFALGGVVVAAIGSPLALLVDAATFLLSALLLRWGLAARPRAGAAADGPGSGVRDVLRGVTAIATDPGRRALVALAWTVGAFVVPEGLAVPYAAQIGASPAVAGLLMAAGPLGSIAGAWAFTRFVAFARRERTVGLLAVWAGLPLVAVVAEPGPVPAMLLWAASGACTAAYLLQTQASFVRATPDAARGAAIGVAASGGVASQGVAVAAGGLLADVLSSAAAIAVCGGTGSAVAAVSALAWWRARRLAQSPTVTVTPSALTACDEPIAQDHPDVRPLSP